MKGIVSLLKKSAKNFGKIGQLSKRLISSTVLSKCGFRKDSDPIRLMLCKLRDSKKPQEIAIIACTDMTLSSVEILEQYAKRWSIEVFFKTCRGFLGFEDDT